MPFHPEASSGQHALDIIQSHSADLGYGWQSGLDASLTSSTSAIESQWTAGSYLWDGATIDLQSGTITHDSGDPDNPRWDALAVTDSSGTVQVIKGTPMPVATDDDGNTYPGEQAWTPSPSDQITRDMVVFAIVWIPAGAANNDDLTNTSAGGVSNPVIDRRVEVTGQERQVARNATITSSGWYRIASVGPVENDGQGENIRASALFSVRDRAGGLHSDTVFWGSLFFDNNPTLSLQNSSYYAGDHGAITDIRLVHPDDTYEGGAIEANVQVQGQGSISVEYTLTHNHDHLFQNWNPEPWTAGSVPTGWNTTELDLATYDPIQAVAADGTDNMFIVQRDGTVVTETQQQRKVATIARLNTNLSVGTSGPVRIPWDVVDEGDWGNWDTSNNVFVTPEDGWYSVRTQARWEGPPDGLRIGMLTDATGYTAQTSWTHTGASTVVSARGDGLFELSAGDEIWVSGRHNGSSSQTIGGVPPETHCYIEYLG